MTSATASPGSDVRSYAARSASSPAPVASCTASRSPRQPTPSGTRPVPASGWPSRKVAAIARSSVARVRRYAAMIDRFSDVRVVAATRSAVSTQARIASVATAAMVYRAPMQPRSWLPERLEGERVVLLRHVPANLSAFYRWYADPEIARLNRHQAGPMRRDEIERFFASRVMSSDTLDARDPRPGDGPAHRVVRVQPGGRRQRLHAVPHHDRRARRLEQGLRDGGDRPHARARVRAPRAPPREPHRLRVQRASGRVVPEVGLRHRGDRPRGDLARRPVLGRARDGDPRGRVAGAPAGARAGARDGGRGRRVRAGRRSRAGGPASAAMA